jgi:NTP pyrophosphatase (non-canonical NTP hydrolase)
MNEFKHLQQKLLDFRDERDWAQFHNSKDLAIALSAEAGELLEVFLWKSPEDADSEKVKEELADVFTFALLLADKYQFDITQIVMEKMDINNRKYPIETSKGNAKKYDEL